MQIDIRQNTGDKITEIVFAEDTGCDAFLLELAREMTKIVGGSECVYIDSKKDAENLIKALQKAIELGNWDD